MAIISVMVSVIPERGIDYDVRTSFHSSFPCLTVRYRTGGRTYGQTKTISMVYGSGGIETPESDVEEANFAEQMAAAWKMAGIIARHHLDSHGVFSNSGVDLGGLTVSIQSVNKAKNQSL